ncbi:MAG: hypothetical protein GY810_29160 [Aureispira sp.]|nr:hypothetical protein [Aureispira sp.]
MNLFKILLVAIILLFSSITAVQATHVLGGDLSYEQIGPNQYGVTLKLYRDCNGAHMPGSRSLHVYSDSCTSVNFSITLSRVSVREINMTCPSLGMAGTACNGGNGSFGYEEHTYKGIVLLPTACPHIVFGAELCCRNNAITNITGSPLFAVVATLNTTANNSSPKFTNVPVIYMSTYEQINISHMTIEADGDSLVYSITNPLKDADNINDKINWITGTSPFDSSTTYAIDSTTGQMTMHFVNAQIPVFDILVEEYRNGVKIGETRRSMQYHIFNNPNKSAQLDSVWVYNDNGVWQNQGTSTTFVACEGEPLHFQMYLSDTSLTDSIYFHEQSSTILGLYPNAIINTSYIGGANHAILDIFIPNVRNLTFSVGVSDGSCPYQNISSYSFQVISDASCIVLSGTIAHDLNSNCTVDSLDQALNNWIVQVEKNGFTTYTTTNINGDYNLTLDTGNYVVTVIPKTAV